LYGRNVWLEDVAQLADDDNGRRNMADLTEFIVRVEMLNDTDTIMEWPSLFSTNMNAPEVIAMYRRFVQEARTVLSRYPYLASFLT
jgi:hypothetical protein